MGWLRHPRTQQERRVNGKRNHITDDDCKVKTRPKRNQVHLPCLWDDVLNHSWYDRSWKRYRKTQYK